jgi:REP element-mobilizing transposase RayT
VSKVRRLRLSDQIFFVSVNLRTGATHFSDQEFPLVIEAFEEVRGGLHFALCGYVLMPDHWHALIWPQHPVTISQVVHEIKRQSALKVNHKRTTRGPLWQRQFWDRFVRNEREFARRVDYMHSNPLRSGLVKRPEEWRWSSHNNFSLQEDRVAACPMQIDYVRLPPDYRA